ncbi:hypothetical protein PODOV006v2_p0036 [Vibrio phage 15E36.1]|uniref:Uncharacterized protein n=1 Tax=Vibrio phage 15E36.1 TaxID=2859290 RepID=A0AAE7XUC5_9CAUD|nr:hypothetical protein PODOV006v2_p0036 [Vibrio phage 15E36.1]
MTNRFSHIKSQRRAEAPLTQPVSQCETTIKGKPKQQRIGRDAYDSLMGLLAEAPESPTTHHGVFIANSTKRTLRKQIEELFLP